MADDIRVTHLDGDHYGVEVTEGPTTTGHRVAVPDAMLDDLGLGDVDRATVVEQSIAFLLEREPATAIRDDFSLEDIPGFFPDYYDELQARLSG